MSIGIIGAGNIGSAFARALARNGISATIANSRGPETLGELTAELALTSPPALSKRRQRPISSSSPCPGRSCRPRYPACRIGPAASSSMPTTRSRHPLQAGRTRRPAVEAKSSPASCPAPVSSRPSTTSWPISSPPIPNAEGGNRVLFYSGDDVTGEGRSRRPRSPASASPASTSARSRFGGSLTQFPGGPLPAARTSSSSAEGERAMSPTPIETAKPSSLTGAPTASRKHSPCSRDDVLLRQRTPARYHRPRKRPQIPRRFRHRHRLQGGLGRSREIAISGNGRAERAHRHLHPPKAAAGSRLPVMGHDHGGERQDHRSGATISISASFERQLAAIKR